MSNRPPRLTDPATLLQSLTGLSIVGPMTAPVTIGSFLFIKLTFGSANTDATFTLAQFGRTPSLYIPAGQSQAGSVYDGSNNRTDWTLGKIVLRASATGSYWLLVA